jgi:hypothetical protein
VLYLLYLYIVGLFNIFSCFNTVKSTYTSEAGFTFDKNLLCDDILLFIESDTEILLMEDKTCFGQYLKCLSGVSGQNDLQRIKALAKVPEKKAKLFHLN